MSSYAQRGAIGRLPRAPTLAADSALGFFESVRNFAIGKCFPRIEAQSASLLAAAGVDSTASLGTLRRAFDPAPGVRTWKRLMRSQQQATWRSIRDALSGREAELEARLDAAEATAPERLRYDRSFRVPEYACHEIHLQPGGYIGDPLAGFVFHHGTQVFYQGYNDQDELHAGVAAMLRPPDDGRVTRILDLACSIGQGTTALKARFPSAEVTGLDVSLPLLRYAHLRALTLGEEVSFVQALAEETGFEASSFDAVMAFILFHEVPASLFTKIIAETLRVLRPGGTFTIIDAPRVESLPPANRLWTEFDAEYNGEPYALDFVSCDFKQLLLDAGFELLEAPPKAMFLDCLHCVKPG
jgi:ubiquinone/menaquinone biosynthesis C-methylase UbiE